MPHESSPFLPVVVLVGGRERGLALLAAGRQAQQVDDRHRAVVPPQLLKVTPERAARQLWTSGKISGVSHVVVLAI